MVGVRMHSKDPLDRLAWHDNDWVRSAKHIVELSARSAYRAIPHMRLEIITLEYSLHRRVDLVHHLPSKMR